MPLSSVNKLLNLVDSMETEKQSHHFAILAHLEEPDWLKKRKKTKKKEATERFCGVRMLLGLAKQIYKRKNTHKKKQNKKKSLYFINCKFAFTITAIDQSINLSEFLNSFC